MTKKTTLALVAVFIMGMGIGAALAYHFVFQSSPGLANSISSEPNNSIPAGVVTTITASSISITKQDRSLATFSITSDTSVFLGQNGQAAAPVTLDAIKVGAMVLITPASADAKAAQTITILPAPPMQ